MEYIPFACWFFGGILFSGLVELFTDEDGFITTILGLIGFIAIGFLLIGKFYL